MSSRDVLEGKVQEGIRLILLTHWDPLDVKSEPGAQAEYDGYVGAVYRLLATGASAQGIIDHLRQVESVQMGLPPSPTATLEKVAVHLKALNVDLGTQADSSHDDSILSFLDASPFALSLEELVSHLGGSSPRLEMDLMRLAEQGRVKMTADKATRAYYTRSIQLK